MSYTQEQKLNAEQAEIAERHQAEVEARRAAVFTAAFAEREFTADEAKRVIDLANRPKAELLELCNTTLHIECGNPDEFSEYELAKIYVRGMAAMPTETRRVATNERYGEDYIAELLGEFTSIGAWCEFLDAVKARTRGLEGPKALPFRDRTNVEGYSKWLAVKVNPFFENTLAISEIGKRSSHRVGIGPDGLSDFSQVLQAAMFKGRPTLIWLTSEGTNSAGFHQYAVSALKVFTDVDEVESVLLSIRSAVRARHEAPMEESLDAAMSMLDEEPDMWEQMQAIEEAWRAGSIED